jgi:hypothetical protein
MYMDMHMLYMDVHGNPGSLELVIFPRLAKGSHRK